MGSDPRDSRFPHAGWSAAVALAAGYLAGAALSFGVRFLNFLPGLEDPMTRRTLVLCGMGFLGATVYGTVAWSFGSGEAEEEATSGGHRPESLTRRLATILAGGVTGVVFYLAVKAVMALSLAGGGTPQIRFSAALVIAFCGGLMPAILRRKFTVASTRSRRWVPDPGSGTDGDR